MTQQQHTIAARRVRWTCRQCGDQVEAEASGDAVEVECPVCGTPRRLAPGGTPAPPTAPSDAMAAAISSAQRAATAKPQAWTISRDNEQIIRRAVRRGVLDAAATLIVLWLALCLLSAVAWLLLERMA